MRKTAEREKGRCATTLSYSLLPITDMPELLARTDADHARRLTRHVNGDSATIQVKFVASADL